MQHKSSTPMAWKLILKPVFMACNLNTKVNKLLDFSEKTSDQRACNQAYSKALKLQKKSNKLLGISQ
jgi:hypothetical protein|tara:strand:+ start:1801 stop:2001 length:201 start_codon:yes stop_codon:yes gene_type:complete